MSNKNISYLQALCSISDDYLEHVFSLNNDEIHAEHKDMFGSESQLRVENIKNLFSKTITDKKKNIVSNISRCRDDEYMHSDIVDIVKDRYGSLKNFFENKFLVDSNMPSGLTLQYRNIKNITDEDIEILIEALYSNGDLKIEDDTN
jgi:hypothetical protein